MTPSYGPGLRSELAPLPPRRVRKALVAATGSRPAPFCVPEHVVVARASARDLRTGGRLTLLRRGLEAPGIWLRNCHKPSLKGPETAGPRRRMWFALGG